MSEPRRYPDENYGYGSSGGGSGGGGSGYSDWATVAQIVSSIGNYLFGGGGGGGGGGEGSDNQYIWQNIKWNDEQNWKDLVERYRETMTLRENYARQAMPIQQEMLEQGRDMGQLAIGGTQQRQEYGREFWDKLQNEYRTPAVSGQDLNRMTGYNLRQTEPTMRSNMAVTGRALGLESPSGQRSMMGQQTRMDEDARFRATNWATERNQRKQMELLSRMTGVQGFY